MQYENMTPEQKKKWDDHLLKRAADEERINNFYFAGDIAVFDCDIDIALYCTCNACEDEIMRLVCYRSTRVKDYQAEKYFQARNLERSIQGSL